MLKSIGARAPMAPDAPDESTPASPRVPLPESPWARLPRSALPAGAPKVPPAWASAPKAPRPARPPGADPAGPAALEAAKGSTIGGWGSSTRSVLQEQVKSVRRSPLQQAPSSLLSTSGKPSFRYCSSSSVILQRASPSATLTCWLYVPVANRPTWADRITVSESPRMATATMTSSRVNPSRSPR